jgi:hypothetical protein
MPTRCPDTSIDAQLGLVPRAKTLHDLAEETARDRDDLQTIDIKETRPASRPGAGVPAHGHSLTHGAAAHVTAETPTCPMDL